MKKEEMKKVIDKLYYLGCRFISFFGGEPTIKKEFIDIVNYSHKKGIFTYVSTNGTMLTSEYIKKLAKAGIDVINLSVDSVIESDESKKNYIRSKKVLDNLIEARKKYGFEITINLVLTSKNIDTTIETIKTFNDLRIPISVGLIIENTYTKERQNEDLFFKTGKEKNKLFKTLNQIKDLKKEKVNIIEPIKYFEDIKKFVNNELSDWYCSAGEYYFSVDSDGKFQICAGLPAEDMTIFDINKNYYKKIFAIRNKRFSTCKKICLSNCLIYYFLFH